jgi:hypothetical protein
VAETKLTHFGDPCIHCGTPHDEVAPGPCPGDPSRAIVIGYCSLGVRWDGVEHYRWRTSDNAVHEAHSHVSNHLPYCHFGRREFGNPPPYDERLKRAALQPETPDHG